MTIISSVNNNIDPVDGSIVSELKQESELRSFPPIEDAIDYVKQIDWQDIRRRSRIGLNGVGLALAVVGEKIHDVGAYLAQVGTDNDPTVWNMGADWPLFFTVSFWHFQWNPSTTIATVLPVTTIATSTWTHSVWTMVQNWSMHLHPLYHHRKTSMVLS